MVARVSPLASTLWDSGLACRGSCPWVVLGLVPRGPTAKEGLIRSCLHSGHTLGLSVPEAALISVSEGPLSMWLVTKCHGLLGSCDVPPKCGGLSSLEPCGGHSGSPHPT